MCPTLLGDVGIVDVIGYWDVLRFFLGSSKNIQMTAMACYVVAEMTVLAPCPLFGWSSVKGAIFPVYPEPF